MIFDLFRKADPPPAPVRAIVATKAENRAVAAQRVNVACQLAVYVATSTPEQRKAETEEAFARLREERRKGRRR